MFRWFFGVFAAGALVLSFAARLDAQTKPLKVGARVITVTTAAQNVQALLTTADITNAGCRLSNPSSTVVCLGGSDVNTTVTDGGKCYPVCNSSSCAEQTVPLNIPAADLYVRAGGSQVIFVLCGGYR